MRLAILEYLAGLREAEELDALLPDLLLSMGIRVLETPKRGIKQYGVDVSAIGRMPGEDTQSLLLFVIKPGDIGRADWEGTQQAVRPSLYDVRSSYIQNCIPQEHNSTPVIVVVCCGGKMEQDVRQEFVALKKSFRAESDIGLECWNGSDLSMLIESHMMDEPVFPTISQSRLRRTLALIDLNEYTLSDFFALLADALSDDGHDSLSTKQRMQRLRQVNLSLRMVIKWAEEADNLRQALNAAERTVLNSWDWLRRKGFPRSLWAAFGRIYRTYDMLQVAFFEKLRPALYVRDGLYGYCSSDRIEYPIRVFETIGFLSTLGLEALAAADISRLRPSLAEVADGLASLIVCNPASLQPCFDEHAIEIDLALFLLYKANRRDVAANWALGLSRHIVNACRLGRHYPLSSDSHDQLIDMEADSWDNLEDGMPLSTIIPMLAEWLLILDMDDELEHLRDAATSLLEKTTLQHWYPCDESDSHIYVRNATNESGTTYVLRNLPSSRESAKRELRVIRGEFPGPDVFSCYSKKLPQLLAMAARHFRTPMHPYWRQTLL